MHNIYTRIIAGTHKYLKENGFERVVLGASGGLDSSLCLKLAVDALSAKNVTAILMPERGVTSEENYRHAKTLCQFLKVEYYSVPINQFLVDYLSLPWKPSELAQINAKARIRMAILYNFANTKNALVIGTSNKTELAVGYGTKYGDLGADLLIIGDLFKEEVYKLAEHVGLPEEIIKKTPSAELYAGQTDEEELGLSYKEIDSILKYAEKRLSKEEIINKGLNPQSVHKVFRLMETNRHKLIAPPIIQVKSKLP